MEGVTENTATHAYPEALQKVYKTTTRESVRGVGFRFTDIQTLLHEESTQAALHVGDV